jgi:hypothetical protein
MIVPVSRLDQLAHAHRDRGRLVLGAVAVLVVGESGNAVAAFALVAIVKGLTAGEPGNIPPDPQSTVATKPVQSRSALGTDLA